MYPSVRNIPFHVKSRYFLVADHGFCDMSTIKRGFTVAIKLDIFPNDVEKSIVASSIVVHLGGTRFKFHGQNHKVLFEMFHGWIQYRLNRYMVHLLKELLESFFLALNRHVTRHKKHYFQDTRIMDRFDYLMHNMDMFISGSGMYSTQTTLNDSEMRYWVREEPESEIHVMT